MNKMTQKDDDLHSIDKEKENERDWSKVRGGGERKRGKGRIVRAIPKNYTNNVY